MKQGIKLFGITGVVAAMMLLLPGCPGNIDDTPDGGRGDAGTDGGDQGEAFPQPANTTAINFSIDTTARAGQYQDGDLEWKGSFTYDETTRVITYDSTWGNGAGPYVPLWDDGPWSAGGHEPAGSVAGDDKFGATVFLAHSATEITIGYGAQTKEGGWIWPGTNGELVVPANAAGPLTAAGFTMLPVGNVDVKIEVTRTAMDPVPAADATFELKGTLTPGPWQERPLFNDGTHGDATAGDNIWTYVLSEDEADPALMASGATAQFVIVVADAEYRDADSPSSVGVQAFTKGPGATTWSAPLTITEFGTDKNPSIVIP